MNKQLRKSPQSLIPVFVAEAIRYLLIHGLFDFFHSMKRISFLPYLSIHNPQTNPHTYLGLAKVGLFSTKSNSILIKQLRAKVEHGLFEFSLLMCVKETSFNEIEQEYMTSLSKIL
jgi:hypothetical protein